jgi:hypothetical protein
VQHTFGAAEVSALAERAAELEQHIRATVAAVLELFGGSGQQPGTGIGVAPRQRLSAGGRQVLAGPRRQRPSVLVGTAELAPVLDRLFEMKAEELVESLAAL